MQLNQRAVIFLGGVHIARGGGEEWGGEEEEEEEEEVQVKAKVKLEFDFDLSLT